MCKILVIESINALLCITSGDTRSGASNRRWLALDPGVPRRKMPDAPDSPRELRPRKS
jgi:hypothetical protein